MTAIDVRAGELQRKVTADEKHQIEKGFDIYSEVEARQAAVHTRQDLILLVAFLGSIANDMRGVKRWIVLIGWLAMLSFIQYVALPFGHSMGWLQ